MILHIDMDAFFAAVEQLDDPRLQGRCVIVGGRSDRAVVSAASYEARRWGVHSAMPMVEARRKCPHGVCLPARMTRYRQVSAAIMDLLRNFTPLMEPVSIDEAYLDVTGCTRLHGSPMDIAREIKRQVQNQLGLTCSVGIAPAKFLAKIASDLDKPDGLVQILPEQVAEFIATLPIERVPGIGRVTQRALAELGVSTLADAGRLPGSLLQRRLGSSGRRLRLLASGVDESAVTPETPAKSISSERTLKIDSSDRKLLSRMLLQQAVEVSRQLRRRRLRARTVVLKVKHADFQQATRSVTLPEPVQSAAAVHQAAADLLAAYDLRGELRLIGVGVAGLIPQNRPFQKGLFSSRESAGEAWEKVDRALDDICERYGRQAVLRASLTGPESGPDGPEDGDRGGSAVENGTHQRRR